MRRFSTVLLLIIFTEVMPKEPVFFFYLSNKIKT